MWKLIEGYKWPYRVSDQGEVQKLFPDGKWKVVRPYMCGSILRVILRREDGTSKRASVSGLVADAFMGGTPEGMVRYHRNGLKRDNSVQNIVFMPRARATAISRPGNSRPVVKLDREGNVVAFYGSQAEAARANHISQTSISKRCLGLVEDPYWLDGYDYKFDGGYNK